MTYFKENILKVKQSPTVAVNELSNKIIAEGRKVYKLGLGQSPFPVPDFLQWELIRHSDKRSYLQTAGLPELRDAISNLHRSVGIKSHADNVLIGSGTKGLMYVAQVIFSGTILVPRASWVSYEPQSIISSTKYKWVQTHKENDFKLTSHELENICKETPGPKMLIINTPNNPTGATYTHEELSSIADVCRKWDIIVLSDEIYGMLAHSSNHKSFATYYPEKTIISDGLSKCAGAGGWRLGYFHIPDELSVFRNKMISVISEIFSSTSAPIQYAAIAAYTKHDKMQEYVKNCNLILNGLSKELAKILKTSNIDFPEMLGGFYCFPGFSKYRDNLSRKNIHNSKELSITLLNETGVAGLGGEHFGCDPEDLRMRLSYVNFSGEKALGFLNEQTEISEDFIKKHCAETLEAFNVLVSWIKNV